MTEHKDQKSDKSSYVWKNKQQYPNVVIKEAVQKIMKFENQNQEHLNVFNLFDNVKNKSELTLLHINEKNKQVSLYSLPKRKSTINIQPEKFFYSIEFSNIRNRFTYMAGLQYKMGGQGPTAFARALLEGTKKTYCLNYAKFLGERLDNYYKATNDRIQFNCLWEKDKYWDFLMVGIARTSRQNYISFLSEKEKQTKIYGLLPPQNNIPKHSNLYQIVYQYLKGPLNFSGSLGYDIANKSLIKQATVSAAKSLTLSPYLDLYLTIQASNIWGKNILKNDYIFKNKKTWIGTRTKNCITPRIQLIFTQYPFFSSLKLKPYLYTQLWTSFSRNALKGFDTNFESQYGIGVKSDAYLFKFQVGLFRFTGQRKANIFGNFKFNF